MKNLHYHLIKLRVLTSIYFYTYIIMGLNRKYKKQLHQMFARTIKNHKQQKIDLENEWKNQFLRKQNEEEDFWDEYKRYCLKSSSEKSRFKDSSYDKTSSQKNNLNKGTIRHNKLHKDWRDDNNGGV